MDFYAPKTQHRRKRKVNTRFTKPYLYKPSWFKIQIQRMQLGCNFIIGFREAYYDFKTTLYLRKNSFLDIVAHLTTFQSVAELNLVKSILTGRHPL